LCSETHVAELLQPLCSKSVQLLHSLTAAAGLRTLCTTTSIYNPSITLHIATESLELNIIAYPQHQFRAQLGQLAGIAGERLLQAAEDIEQS
jgi:hypothetical protein